MSEPRNLETSKPRNLVTFSVPLVPPSVNHYKLPHSKAGGRRGFYLSPAAQAFLDAVVIFGRQAGKCEGERFGVHLGIYLPTGQRGDADNFAKCCLDGLQKAGVIANDSNIRRLVIELHDIDGQRHRDGKTDFKIYDCERWKADPDLTLVL